MHCGMSCSVLDTSVSHKDVSLRVESQTSSMRCGQGGIVHRRGWAVAGMLLAAVCMGEGRGAHTMGEGSALESDCWDLSP